MPEACRLVLLEQLSAIDPGSKVRFLGCVHAYDTKSAILTLRTHYPATEVNVAQANVEVEDIAENLNHDLLSVGAWLNVVGYIHATRTEDEEALQTTETSRSVRVKATMIWSAGAIRMDRYNAAVREYQAPLG